MLGARLVKGRMPAVIMMHGTGGIRYSGVYYAAALNGAGIAQNAAQVPVRISPGTTHIFDSFAAGYEINDPGANRRKGGIIHVRPDPQARKQARDDLVAFFVAAFGLSRPG